MARLEVAGVGKGDGSLASPFLPDTPTGPGWPLLVIHQL